MMHLHENTELFRDAVLATAQQFGFQEIFIEKDYWVHRSVRNYF
nr:hypothetical protein [Mucilaginibacter sp. SP1R1]